MFWVNGQLNGFGNLKRSYLDGSVDNTIAETNMITPCEETMQKSISFTSIKNFQIVFLSFIVKVDCRKQF